MKYIHILIIGFLFHTGLISQNVFRDIENQDVTAILTASDEEIDLCILDAQNIYSKDEAKVEIMAFFDQYPPASCQAVHSGSSRKNSNTYQLGKMTATSGEIFRVFVYTNEANKVIELRIDEW